MGKCVPECVPNKEMQKNINPVNADNYWLRGIYIFGGDEEDRTYHRLFSLRKHLCVQVEIFSNKVYYSCARNYVREERYKSVCLNVYLKGTNFPNLSGKN